MTTFEIEVLDVLNQHAEQLKSAFYRVNSQLNMSQEKPLQVKEIVELCRAFKEGRAPDSLKFPNLSYEMVEDYGVLLRYPYQVLCHFIDFQMNTIKALSDVINESKVFDIAWNYAFVLPIMRLFTNYVKLHVFLSQIADIDKVPIVYGYCYNKKAKNELENLSRVTSFVRERTTYKLLESELQIVNDHFFTLFSSIENVMQQVLGASMSYEWSLINISDNPVENEEGSPEFPFFKKDYIVMIHLEEICECFVCYCLINMKVISSGTPFAILLQQIVAHKSTLSLYGETKADLHRVFEDMRKARNKRNDDLSAIDKAKELAIALIPIRDNRCRRLTMILNEFMNAAMYDPSIICSKLIIFLAMIGFSNFEVNCYLSRFNKDTTESLISLIYKLVQTITYCMTNFHIIERFLIFNFREYDGPFLDTKAHSFHIPQSDYNRISLVIEALRTIDIELYDNGQSFDLSGLKMNLQRIMTSFNRFSTSNGILHLSPLFNLISAIYFRVNFYTNGLASFLEFAPLQMYWKHINAFESIAQDRNTHHSGHIASLFALAHFFSFDSITPKENPEVVNKITNHVRKLFSLVYEGVLEWSSHLQNESLAMLRDQTEISSILNKNPREGKPQKLSDIPASQESLLSNRAYLTPIHDRLTFITDTMLILREIGAIHVYGKKVDVLTTLMSKMKSIMVDLFNKETNQSPYSLLSKIQTTEIIIEHLMTAASIDPSPVIRESLQMLFASPLIFDGDNVTIDPKGIGKLSRLYFTYYQQLLKEDLLMSFFSTTNHSFFNKKKKKSHVIDKNDIHYYASLSSLHVLYGLIGINGMAAIDIIAVETIVRLFEKLTDLIKEALIPQEGIPKFSDDPCTFHLANDIISSLCQIGSIVQFRHMLHRSVPEELAIGKFSFLNQKTEMAKDTLLQNRLKGKVKVFTHPEFPLLFGCLFSHPYWGKIKYNPLHDAFMDNSHLIGGTIDCIVSSLNVQIPDFDTNRLCHKLLKNAYVGINRGKQNIERTLCEKWPSLVMTLILDHIVKQSQIIDYTLLEPVISYRIIRSIYTIVLGNQ